MEYEFIRIECDGTLDDMLSKLEPLRGGKWEYATSVKDITQKIFIILKRKERAN